MIDHVSLGVTDMDRSLKFYDAVLQPLGMKRYYDHDGGSGYGLNAEKPFFWIGTPLDEGRPARSGGGNHVAFAASNRKAVDDFFRAAIAAGAKDDGKPGLRPIYHENYYGAFVLDPDGHKIEACCHKPE
ncbi:MAG TPA: VOC family protein [Dongiaceae bacterium]|jgi:catechol 2,3-dioxygenase-like lactoylglutathione lyase family enzyme